MVKSIFLFLFGIHILSIDCFFSQSTNIIYTGNGVFVVPEGVFSITVECIGGGGGGARAATAYRGRGGGGGGAYAKSVLQVTPTEEYAVQIGLGGDGGNATSNGGNGQAGGSSIFGNNLVLAVGGEGALNDQNPGANGGQSLNSIFNIIAFNGGKGGNGTANCTQCGTSGGGGGGAGSGGNGNSALGAAGGLEKLEYGGKGANGSSGTSDGANGFNYGGGGSGGRRGSSFPSRPGGSGANGLVVVTYNLCNQNLTGTDIISSCAPITWIDGNTYSTSNNTATHLLEGAAQNGCDSLVTLNFTLWPCTQLRAIDCGATNVAMNQILRAINVGMPQYRFRITGANNGGPGWNNNQFIYDTPIGQNHFRFQFVPGAAWGATYAVDVAVGDGAGNYGPYGNVCNVTLENQTTTQIVSATCGATVTMDNFVQTDWAPGAVGYRFRIQGANNGGAGWSGNTFIYETTAPVRSFKFNNHIPGALFGETYSIDVAVLSGDNVWLPYGSACNVTIAAPSTQIQASQCGATGVALSTSVLADNVVGASGYRFRISGANSTNWMNDQFILNRPNRVMQFQMVGGVLPGEIYQVEVAVMDANGNYGAYGSSCNVTLAGTPSIVINDENDLSSERESFMADKSLVEVAFGANASHNPFTTEFGIQVLNAHDTDFINVAIYDMSGKLIERNAVNPMDIEAAKFGSNLASGMYMVEVRQGSNQAVIRQVKN